MCIFMSIFMSRYPYIPIYIDDNIPKNIYACSTVADGGDIENIDSWRTKKWRESVPYMGLEMNRQAPTPYNWGQGPSLVVMPGPS